MAWTTPATVVTGDIITAAYGNTYVRDNTAYLKGLLDGTGGAVTVTVPSQLNIANDANFNLIKAGSIVQITFDSGGDGLVYDRTANTYNFYIGNAVKLTLDANSKLTGAGFYDSGVFAVTAGATVTLTHGFGAAQPRFVWGYWNTGALDVSLPLAAVDAPAGAHRFGQIFTTAGTIDVINGGAATINAHVFAMR